MPDALDGLNRSQEQAVTYPGGPLVVVAGAGTGKTRTLTRRFAWLVEQGVPADEILALTFSSAAAAEMRERLESLIESPYEELHVATFHAFCTRLLQDEALEACVDPFLSPVTPADRLALLLERIGELTLRHHEIRGNPAPLLASFVSRIDRLKDEMVSAADYRGYAERLAAERRGRRRAGACRPRARVRPPLRRPRPPAVRARRARLRRPDPAGLPAAARAPARARAGGAPLPARARRRVPGHELRPGDAAAAARRGAPQRHGRRRRRPGDLPLPRRVAEEPARLPARVPRGRPSSASSATTAPAGASSLQRPRWSIRCPSASRRS